MRRPRPAFQRSTVQRQKKVAQKAQSGHLSKTRDGIGRVPNPKPPTHHYMILHSLYLFSIIHISFPYQSVISQPFHIIFRAL
jgi:hypothetical protein